MEFYDIHSHILFGVDDGSKDYEMSCKMVDMAYREGIRHICATPHYNRKSAEDIERPAKIRQAFRKLQLYIASEYPDMHLYLGNEVMYYSDMARDLEEGRIMLLNGSRYVLVEFKPGESYRTVYGGLQQVLHMRRIPVLAHVERLDCLWGDWDRLDELKDAYVVLQMNMSSLIGGLFDKRVRQCRKLVSEGYIDVLGTDMHNLTSRAPKYKEAAAWIEKKCGRDRLRQLAQDNPRAILANQMID